MTPTTSAGALPQFPGCVLEEDLALIGTSAAVYSPDRSYRYLLTRTWGSGPLVAWVMLNPSTGGAVATDPTIIRCVNFSRRWGAGGLMIVNLFGLRSPAPAALAAHPGPVGPGNDTFIRDATADAALTVAAWGAHGQLAGRAAEVTRALAAAGTQLHCLGRTKDGSPRHPLYVRAGTPLRLFGTAEPVAGAAASPAGEPVTGPARRLTDRYRAGDNAVLTGHQRRFPEPRHALEMPMGPAKGARSDIYISVRPDPAVVRQNSVRILSRKLEPWTR
ncbi:MAG TPA: DUF1643 domain-containing protein [Streptosporangiaceae bacterium]